MKYLRKFNSIQEMQTAIAADEVSFIGLVHPEGQEPTMNIHVHEIIYPHDLVISCSNNIVTITAEPVGEVTIEYRLNYEGEYVTYTEPFAITETVIVNARAMTEDASINRNQQCEYVNPIDYTIPFYIEDISGSDNTVQIKKLYSAAPTLTIEKSLDGSTWESMGDTSTTGITATIPASNKLYLRCNTTKWSLDPTSTNCFNTISITNNCNVGGNILSLVYGNTFNGQTDFSVNIDSYVLRNILIDNTKLINAKDLLLPATTLTGGCYQAMFSNCTSLTTAPALPATTLNGACYQAMFSNCTSLTTAPVLPATTLAGYCYYNMFVGCTALTTAPVLPATTLAGYCYYAMFKNCTSLTTAPELPATTLVTYCYRDMFYGCTSLTTAPELPATTLTNYCYQGMFSGCTNLNYIKCLATNISASSCTNQWVSGVAASGTFVKDPNMSSWTTGVNGIPTGWVITSSGIRLSQSLNVATIQVTNIDSGTGYYTINGGSHTPLNEGTTNVPITQAMNGQTLLAYGEFSGEPTQETLTLSWVDYSPSVTITESNNYVTITSATADSITYRLGSSGEYTNYTAPVYIASDTTIYVTATRTVSGVDYTSTASQAVTHELMPPTNLTISCTNNFVTITATGAATLEYNLDGSSTYTVYTQPFLINQSGTVYAKATNVDGSITASQAVAYVDYRPTITISESNNYVTITAPNADTIQYRLGSTGEYTNYTAPVYIASDTTIYVTATRTVSGVDYTSTDSQEVEHELIPPTNLTISCSGNTVTITADNATTIEYNFDGSSTYTTYTEPFAITQTVTVYAKASNADGSITASQECVYSTIPFIDNCILYAPFIEGDLTDHISGQTLVNGSGNVTWDSSLNMYNFAAVTKANEMYFPVDLSVNIPNQEYTMLAEIKGNYGTYNYPCIVVIGGYSDSASGTDGSWRPSLVNWKVISNRGDRMYVVLVVNGSSNVCKCIYDGTSTVNQIDSGSNTTCIPSNWNTLMKSRVAINASRRDLYIYATHIKDVRIYNFALTDAQILQAIGR